MYAKDISKKVRSSLIVKKYSGEFVGKLAPYGYIKDPKDKHKFLIDKNDLEKYLDVFDILKIEEKETVRFKHKKNYLIFFAKKK